MRACASSPNHHDSPRLVRIRWNIVTGRQSSYMSINAAQVFCKTSDVTLVAGRSCITMPCRMQGFARTTALPTIGEGPRETCHSPSSHSGFGGRVPVSAGTRITCEFITYFYRVLLEAPKRRLLKLGTGPGRSTASRPLSTESSLACVVSCESHQDEALGQTVDG